jgi:hypothetical protein
MGRDDDAARTDVGHDPDEIPGVETEDGPAVRAQVAKPGQPRVELLHGLEIGRQNEEVDLPTFLE